MDIDNNRIGCDVNVVYEIANSGEGREAKLNYRLFWYRPYTIRYDSVYLTCSKKLTGSQLSLPHGINKKLKCETKNKMMSVIAPVQSCYREAVQKVKEIYGGKDLLKM